MLLPSLSSPPRVVVEADATPGRPDYQRGTHAYRPQPAAPRQYIVLIVPSAGK